MLSQTKRLLRPIVRRIRLGNRVRIDAKVRNAGFVSGLAGLEMTIVSPWSDAVGLQLVVRVGTNEVFRDGIRCVDGFASERVVLHTHLLPNGSNRIEIECRTAEGALVGAHRVAINVVNESDLAEGVRASLVERATPLVVREDIDSGDYAYDDSTLVPWFDRADAVERIDAWVGDGSLNADEADRLRQFVRDGYLVVEDAIDSDLLDRVGAELDDVIASGYEGYVDGSSERIEGLHLHYPAIRQLWTDRRWLRFVDLVFRVPARPCQSLVFVYGSQQSPHQDVAYLTPFPSGYMCGAWIALEDIRPDSGELVIYPGSHRLQKMLMTRLGYSKGEKRTHRNSLPDRIGTAMSDFWRSLVTEHHIEPITYRPKRGSVLVWHESLVHGGSPRLDPTRSRRSMVVHSFADGALGYFDHSGYIAEMLPKEERSVGEPAVA